MTEDLTTLLLEHGRHRALPMRTLEPAVGGALLLELLAGGFLDFGTPGVLPYRRQVAPTGVEPSDDLLRRAVHLVGGPVGAGLPAVQAVERLGMVFTDVVLERLTAAGIAEHRSERVLGVLRHDRWVVRDLVAAERVSARLRRSLLTGAPDPHDAAALAVLTETSRPLPLAGLSWSGRRAAQAAAREIVARVPGRAAVRSAVLAVADGGGSAAAVAV
jgi:hypothetical protein